MTEETIIYEDRKYKFYENRIYSKTRFHDLEIYLNGRGNGRGKFRTQKRYWSFIRNYQPNNPRIKQINYPITMESINSVYLQ